MTVSSCTPVPVPATNPWNVEVAWDTSLLDPEYQAACEQGAVVVDMDGDGVSDVVCVTAAGITTWSGTSLASDGTVPRTPAAPWLTTHVWRGQPTSPIAGSDLALEILDACNRDCQWGEAALSVRIVNLGHDEVPDGVDLSVYSEEGGFLGSVHFPGWLDDGTMTATHTVLLPVDTAKAGIRLVIDREGDCDPDNSTVEWRLDACD